MKSDEVFEFVVMGIMAIGGAMLLIYAARLMTL